MTNNWMLFCKIRNKVGMSVLATSTQHCTGYAIRHTHTKSNIHIGGSKNVLILYTSIANPKESRYIHLPGTNKFSKVLADRLMKKKPHTTFYFYVLISPKLKNLSEVM